MLDGGLDILLGHIHTSFSIESCQKVTDINREINSSNGKQWIEGLTLEFIIKPIDHLRHLKQCDDHIIETVYVAATKFTSLSRRYLHVVLQEQSVEDRILHPNLLMESSTLPQWFPLLINAGPLTDFLSLMSVKSESPMFVDFRFLFHHAAISVQQTFLPAYFFDTINMHRISLQSCVADNCDNRITGTVWRGLHDLST